LPSGALPAGDTTTAARAEAQQATPEAAQKVHETAEHTKGVAEHAASRAHTRGSGVTGNAYDAVTQLHAKVGETTDAAVAEGQKDVQAVANAGASYLGQAKDLASSAISTAASYLPTSLTGAGGTTGDSPKPAQGAPGENTAPGGVPASSAKLESGSHTVGNPYPASDVDAQRVAVNESK